MRTSNSSGFSLFKLAAGGAVAVAFSASGFAQPANNLCANAIAIGEGTFGGTTVGATNDGAGTCGTSSSTGDVWFRYIAPFDGTLSVTTCGTANYDTVLGIWTGCPNAGGTELSCNDDSCNLQSTVTATMTAGDMRYIRVSGFNGAAGDYQIVVSASQGSGGGGGGGGGTLGADVLYGDITDVSSYGPVNGIRAYAFGTATCNIGDANLRWGNSWGGTPSVGFNAYRLHNGRLIQLGQSLVKKSCCAGAGSGCGTCNGQGGSVLGSGCRDVYGSGYNGGQGVLARRSSINAFTGAHNLISAGTGDAVWGRLQVLQTDLNTTTFAGAQYFGEGVYVGSDDAASHNAMNNASYRRMTPNQTTFALTVAATTVAGQPAIYAWRDHGLGANTPDPSVHIQNVDVPNEGRYVVADKVTDLGNGTWRYDYAVFNLNSDVSGGGFVVPVPAGVSVTNTGFHGVPYHSGEPYSNADWVVTNGAGLAWRSPQTYAQNQNSNALRWGTMYNFWFEANRGPTDGTLTLELFKPSTPQAVGFTARVPATPRRAADFNDDGAIDLTDLAMLLTNFGCAAPRDCTAGDVDHDGDIDLSDLSAMLAVFGT